MKVICDRAALVESLGLVGAAVVSRTPKPVLTCVKITAATAGEGGELTLSATDLEVAVRMSTPRVDVQETGEALIPADKLAQIVRESLDPTLALETEGASTHIKGQDSHFRLHGYPVADFPAVPEFTGEADFEILAADLTMLVNQTAFATARENSRYAINGVLIERDGNKISVIATDGRRLALAKGTCKAKKNTDGQPTSAIVPSKALNMLQRLLTEGDQTVRVKLTDNQILFATDTAVLSSNLVEGNFPPYKDVIPRDADKKATLGTDALLSAVRRAALLTNDESKGVSLGFEPGKLTLASRAPEMGDAEVTMDLPKYDGEPVKIGFNPQFILDALKVAQADQVTFEFKAANKPGIIRTGPNFLYVVMPVNLQS